MNGPALFAHGGAWPVLLLAPAVAVALLLLDAGRRRRLDALVGPRRAALTRLPRGDRRRPGILLFAGGLLLALAALLHPVFGEDAPTVEPRGADLVVALDVSRSMRARDVAPDRLSRAQAEVEALCARATGDRLGLVLFAGEARRVVPLTRDLASVARLAALADTTSVERGGTDLAAGLEAARLALAAREGEHAAILLLTDGDDPEGRAAVAAAACRAAGIRVHAVGLGTALGSKIPREDGGGYVTDRAGTDVVSALDAVALRRVAEAGGGVAADGSAPGALVRLYEDEVVPAARSSFESVRRLHRENRYQAPLLAALLLWLADLALAPRGRRSRRRDPAADREA